MKKNISINLFGTLYNIDEDAYNLLDSYLKSMSRYFSRQEGGSEIADDIEHRVAELLWKRHEEGMKTVDIRVVKEIIDSIGKAEDIDVKDSGTYNKSEKSFREDFNQFSDEAGRFARNTYNRGSSYVRSHRFYRQADDKVLGGVCSGLATYFNAGEPLIWRLGAIALTLLGIGLPLPIIYIVVWLVTPAALTPEDRLRQQGREVTPDSLAQQVVSDAEPIVVKEESKGCLKGLLVVLAICVVLPLIIWGWMMLKVFANI